MTFSTDFILGALSAVFALVIFYVVLKVFVIHDLTKTIDREFKERFGKWLKK